MVSVKTKPITEFRQLFPVIFAKWNHDFCSGNIIGLQKDVWISPTDSSVNIVPGPTRVLFPVLALVTNTISLAFVWFILAGSNFASQVLTVYVMNATAYLVYYIFMKV